MTYPNQHFPGTPAWGRRAVLAAIRRTAVQEDKWRVPLEAIARYETDWHVSPPYATDLRGLMQQSIGQYRAAFTAGLIHRIDYDDPVQAIVVAIRYIQGKLPGYGGYGGITGLLRRTDRGPGEVLRTWQEVPDATYQELRYYYHGY